MNAGQLHRLARLLREIALLATANPGERPVPGVLLAIVEDVARHPGTSVTHLAERNGLAQSVVSKCVAQLRDRGVLLGEADPTDGRRTLISVAPDTHAAWADRGARPVTEALHQASPGLTPDRTVRVLAALDTLAEELLDSRCDQPAS